MRTRPLLLATALIASLATGAVPARTPAGAVEAADPPVLSLVTGSGVETFHDSDTQLCGTSKVHIDGPVRAFEDQNHVIHLTVSDPNATGWQWTGSVTGFTNDPTTAALDCTPVMTGNSGNNDPAAYDQKTWIQGLYFKSPTVYAYGHEDYFGTRLDDPDCHQAGTTDGLPTCWYSSIPVWRADVPATGRHISFGRTATPPDHVAIYPKDKYPGDSATPTAGWLGYGTPSNIVRGRNQDGTLDGYSYMFAYIGAASGTQAKGVCLFRSADPSSRTGWRAWDGSSFSVRMSNPYDAGVTNAACTTVNPGTFNTYVRSVVWHKPSRHYIAVFRDSAGVRYATSRDLLTWNASLPLVAGDSAALNYPVVVDFDGGDYGDDNFDRVYGGGKTYLFYRKSIEPGHTRIARHHLTVTNYVADPPGSGNPN